jgi:hypothetical protein
LTELDREDRDIAMAALAGIGAMPDNIEDRAAVRPVRKSRRTGTPATAYSPRTATRTASRTTASGS